jgi:hypothetical protein
MLPSRHRGARLFETKKAGVAAGPFCNFGLRQPLVTTLAGAGSAPNW